MLRVIAPLIVAEILTVSVVGAGVSRAEPMVDPEVRALVSAGRARVLVELRIAETDEARRAGAIGRAQDAVLARMPGSHASVVRRYTSVPTLALEIDATALRSLEAMTDVVAGVKLDRTVAPQQ